MIRKLLNFLGALLLTAAFCVGVVAAGGGSGIERSAPVSRQAAGTAGGESLEALTATLGGGILRDRETGSGTLRDVKTGSLQAQLLTWTARDGLEIGAVCPPEAAQLLRREGLTLRADRWEIQGQTLIVAESPAGACAYCSLPDAAFSFFLAGVDADTLLARIAAGVVFPSPNQ